MFSLFLILDVKLEIINYSVAHEVDSPLHLISRFFRLLFFHHTS